MASLSTFNNYDYPENGTKVNNLSRKDYNEQQV